MTFSQASITATEKSTETEDYIINWQFIFITKVFLLDRWRVNSKMKYELRFAQHQNFLKLVVKKHSVHFTTLQVKYHTVRKADFLFKKSCFKMSKKKYIGQKSTKIDRSRPKSD